MVNSTRNFIDICDFDRSTLEGILHHAMTMKQARHGKPKGLADDGAPGHGRVLAMIFEKASTRTRVSFDVAMRQLGGSCLTFGSAESHLGRGESIADTAQVLSRYVDAVVIRTFDHDSVTELSRYAGVPVINGLTDFSHPCQIMADLLTLQEKTGGISGKVVAWSGDMNNVAMSWIHAAIRFDFALRIAAPAALQPDQATLDWAREQGGSLIVTDDPNAAVEGADCVVTDAWSSLHEKDSKAKEALLAPFQVDEALMARAAPEAVFMHCLPAYRGKEVSAAVLDGPQSVVFDEAENRLHAQKAILSWCLGLG